MCTDRIPTRVRAVSRPTVVSNQPTEIAESLTSSGGSAEEADGPFGRELRARIPVPDSAGALQPARFLGVDGLSRHLVHATVVGML